jgi:hypothetical protein
MPGRAQSATKKNREIQKEKEDWRARAVAAYKAELLKPGKRKGCRVIAKDFMDLYKMETGRDIKLDYNFIRRGAQGGRTRAQVNAARTWLTPGETDIVIQYIVECGHRGFPLSHKRLREHVNEILRARLGVLFPEEGVGKKWTSRFVEKYSDQLKMSWATSLESKRGRAVNEHTLKAWFDLVEDVTTKYNIVKENTYGTDEIGTNPRDGERERVMGGHNLGPQYQQRDGTRENITVIVTICADGTSTPPAVIFKGQAYQVHWKQDNPINAS